LRTGLKLSRQTNNIDETRIIAVITQNNLTEILKLGKNKSISDQISHCSTIEYRADTFPQKDIINNLRDLYTYLQSEYGERKRLLFTVRLPNDGGNWNSSLADRYRIIQKALNLDIIDWLDIEIEEADNMPEELNSFIREKQIQLLLSHHNFNRSYNKSKFLNLLEKMEAHSPDLVKFSVMVQNDIELSDFFAFALILRQRFSLSCLMSMGTYGPWSRVLLPLLGCPITYGYVGDKPVVDGQLEVRELSDKIQKIEKSGLIEQGTDEIIRYITSVQLKSL